MLGARSSLWQHVTRRHKVSWEDYIEEHGDPATEVNSALHILCITIF